MQVHTFRADSLQAALQQVRQSLGPDASILHTREKQTGRLGLFRRSFIEVEATLDVPLPSCFSDAHSASTTKTPAEGTSRRLKRSPLSRHLQPATAQQPTTPIQASETPARGEGYSLSLIHI